MSKSGRKILFGLIGFALDQCVANAANTEFLATISKFPQHSSMYGCDIEAWSEAVDDKCVEDCSHRVFLRVTAPGRPARVLAMNYRDTNVSVRNFMVSGEYYYYSHPQFVAGVPTVAGAVQTGKNRRILSLRLWFDDGVSKNYFWCRGLTPRLQGAGAGR